MRRKRRKTRRSNLSRQVDKFVDVGVGTAVGLLTINTVTGLIPKK